MIFFQGETAAENNRVRSSMKYWLPIRSVVLPAAVWRMHLCRSGPTYSRWLVTALHGRSS